MTANGAAQLGNAASSIKARCSDVTSEGVMWQSLIHFLFIVSAVGIAWTDKLMSAHKAPSKAH